MHITDIQPAQPAQPAQRAQPPQQARRRAQPAPRGPTQAGIRALKKNTKILLHEALRGLVVTGLVIANQAWAVNWDNLQRFLLENYVTLSLAFMTMGRLVPNMGSGVVKAGAKIISAYAAADVFKEITGNEDIEVVIVAKVVHIHVRPERADSG